MAEFEFEGPPVLLIVLCVGIAIALVLGGYGLHLYLRDTGCASACGQMGVSMVTESSCHCRGQ